MRHIKIIFCLLAIACQKEKLISQPLASLKLINVVAGGASVAVRGYPNYIQASNNNSADYSLYPGNADLYVWPEGDSLHPYYTSEKSLLVNESDVYSLFLGGTPDAVEGILVKESLSYYKDSVAGVRFVNLSPNSSAVNVTLSTTPEVNEFSGILFKGITDFKLYPANSANVNYTFQVRDAAINKVLASITMNGASLERFVPRFRNTTIVFRGVIGGSPAPGITRVNHYPTF